MKRTLLVLLSCTALFCSSCQAKIDIKVVNDSKSDRTLETVELCWKAITVKDAKLTPDNVVVLLKGKQIPSQVIFTDGDSTKPCKLIFQATVAAGQQAKYVVRKGRKEQYEAQAYSRFVPERKDDYAWENNLVAHRVYGKVLEVETRTQGVDIWSKCVSHLIVDKWYAEGHYHKNKGEGMDCYKVGPTLGGGASAVLHEGKPVLTGNMIAWKRTANGPIRTSFTLNYAPFVVGKDTITVTKTYSLDANTHFTKVVDLYDGTFDNIDVAAGFVVHTTDAPRYTEGKAAAIFEPASDDKKKVGGNIGIAVIAPTAQEGVVEADGHLLKKYSVKAGATSTYYIGSAWSLGGVPEAQNWFSITAAGAEAIASPLKVVIE